MAEPAWKMPLAAEADHELADGEPSEITILQRWVERPGGRMELLELPLTPELFLDPQLEDIMVQGRPHSLVRRFIADLLDRYLESDPGVMVLEDVKHTFGPGLPGPAPDVSVIRGARHPDPDLNSFDAIKQGTVPCLVVEIVSPRDARIRRTDEVDKVHLYQKVGIVEYLLVDLPRRATAHRFRLKGYRLGPDGRYRTMEPDAEGFLVSKATQVRFGISPAGDRIDLYDTRTGVRLLSPREEAEGRKAEAVARQAAEERADAEAAARRAAEAEVERLRAEIAKLKKRP